MENAGENKERTWTILCHLSALTALLGIPFANIFGPFLVWLLKKSEYPAIDAPGRESMNFQISMTIYAAITGILAIGLTPVLIGFLFYPVVAVILVADIILTIRASIKASNGIPYRYPFTIRLI